MPPMPWKTGLPVTPDSDLRWKTPLVHSFFCSDIGTFPLLSRTRIDKAVRPSGILPQAFFIYGADKLKVVGRIHCHCHHLQSGMTRSVCRFSVSGGFHQHKSVEYVPGVITWNHHHHPEEPWAVLPNSVSYSPSRAHPTADTCSGCSHEVSVCSSCCQCIPVATPIVIPSPQY